MSENAEREETIAALLRHGEEARCIELSDFNRTVEALGLSEEYRNHELAETTTDAL
jgi:hypothetical protein